MKSPIDRRRPWLLKPIIALVSLLLTLLALEIGLRWLASKPLLALEDFRALDRSLYKLGLPIQFDGALGWMPRPGYSGTDKWGRPVTILEDSVRSNGHGDRTFRTPPILAVGDSFTFGDNAPDDGTWPAILEDLSGRRVINGGVSAYATDQSWLRLKRLLPLHSPSTVIFSFIPLNIERSERAVSFGVNKPYFRVDEGRLRLMNSPVPRTVQFEESLAYRALGHSFLAHTLMMKTMPNRWLSGRKPHVLGAPGAGGEITCLIFEELARLKEDQGVEQVYVLLLMSRKIPSEDLEAKITRALECIDPAAVTLIDVREELLEIRKKDPERYRLFYAGHMTRMGNTFVAKRVLETLRQFDESSPPTR